MNSGRRYEVTEGRHAWGLSLALAGACLAGAVAPVVGQTCPAQVKKDIVSEGVQSALPDGWFVFTPGATRRGIVVSPLRQYQPSQLSTTTADAIFEIDISQDGRWILYGTDAREIYLVRPNNTGRTRVPIGSALADIVCGFVKSGPYGPEVYYRASGALKAIRVNLDGDTPVFGAERTLVSFAFPATLGPGEGSGVAANHVWGNYNNVGRMLTIPNNGTGVGTTQHLFNATGTMDYSCANTISPDGSMVAQNPGENEDGSGCIPIAGPGWSLGLNHKGFVVMPFHEYTEASITWYDMYRSRALSVNWCPERFRYGAYNESGFVRWYFGNNQDYVIGARNASLQPYVYGAWLVNWRTNTWTLLTPESLKVDEPAVFFTSGVSLRQPRGGGLSGAGPSVAGVRLWTLDGRPAVAGRTGAPAHGVMVRDGGSGCLPGVVAHVR